VLNFFLIQGLIFPEMKTAARAELNNYNQTNHSTSTVGWNTFHSFFGGCCGVEGYEDWFGTNFDNTTGGVPDSCCLTQTIGCGKGIKNEVKEKIKEKIYTKGCISKLQTILKDQKILIGVSAFVILIGFFLAVLTSCNVAREMSEESMAKDPKNYRMKVRKVDHNGVWTLVTDYDTVDTSKSKDKWTPNCAIL